MFNEATILEILLPLSGNINEYATHIYENHVDLERNRTYGPG